MTRRHVRSTLAVLALVPITLVMIAGPAAAARLQENDQVVISGRIDVPEGQTVGDVVILHGPVTVEGTVDGDLFALNGDVTISGEVTGDVVVANGDVSLADGAHVGGDLVSRTTASVAAGAAVDGQRKTFDAQILLGRLRWISAIAVWIAVTVSTFVLGALLLLFAPRAAEAVADTARLRGGASFGWGAALFFGLPIAAVVALVTIVGIPFGVGLLLALALIYTLGYVAGAYALGRLLMSAPASPWLAFIVGWGIARGVSIVPFLAAPVWIAATLWGLGAIIVAGRRAGRRETAVAVPSIPPPPSASA